MKNAIFIFALVFSIGALAFAFYNNDTADRAVGELNQERYSRMVAEEKLLKTTEAHDKLKAEFGSVQAQLKNQDKLLKQVQSLNKDLQDKLQESETNKSSLEKRLQDANKALSVKPPVSATGEI